MGRSQGIKMKQDISRTIVEKVQRTLDITREAWLKKVPYGPSKVYMTPKEARLMWQGMDESTKQSLMQSMGPDNWTKLMAELYGGK